MMTLVSVAEFLYNEADDSLEYERIINTVETAIESSNYTIAIEMIDELYGRMFGCDFFEEKSEDEFKELMASLRITDPEDVAVGILNTWLTYEETFVDVPDIDDPVLGLHTSIRRAY